MRLPPPFFAILSNAPNGDPIFTGPVPSYEVVDLAANYGITPRVRVGLDVSNLLDNRHYELFGGDLIDRRALAHVAFSW